MKTNLLLLCLFSSIMFSCKKKKNETVGPDVRVEENNNAIKYLVKMTEICEGVTTAYEFNYDDNNRVSLLIKEEGNILKERRSFTYDTAGKLEMLRIEYPGQEYYESYTFQYDGNGIPKKFIREYLYNGFIRKYHGVYTVADGKVRKITEISPGQDSQTFIDFTYSGKNIIGIDMSSTDIPEAFYSFNLATGSKKSPLGAALRLEYALLTEFALECFSENETINIKAAYGPNPVIHNEITYQYDAQGYPVSSERIEHERSNIVTKTTYQYK